MLCALAVARSAPLRARIPAVDASSGSRGSAPLVPLNSVGHRLRFPFHAVASLCIAGFRHSRESAWPSVTRLQDGTGRCPSTPGCDRLQRYVTISKLLLLARSVACSLSCDSAC